MRLLTPLTLGNRCRFHVRNQLVRTTHWGTNLFNPGGEAVFDFLCLAAEPLLRQVTVDGADANRRTFNDVNYFAILYPLPGSPEVIPGVAAWGTVGYQLETDLEAQFEAILGAFFARVIRTNCFNRSNLVVISGLAQAGAELVRTCLR